MKKEAEIMNEKLLDVVKKILESSNKISDVAVYEDEFFFKYEKKNYWSVSYRRSADVYTVRFYPNYNGTINNLIGVIDAGPEPDDLVVLAYRHTDFDSEQMAKQLFRKLYWRLKEMYYNLDQKFDDMLNT